MKSKISVLITGIGGNGVGSQIQKALGLAKTPYRLIGVDMSPIAYGLFEADESYVVPPASNPRYLDAILKICQRKNINVIIPGTDPELLIVSNNKDRFLEIGVTPIVNPPTVVETCTDKWRTMQFLQSNGFCCPKTELIENESDISKVDFYPAVIKPSKGSSGSRNVFVAQTKEELHLFSRYLLRQGQIPLVQEYIGSYDEEYTIGVIALEPGEIAGSIALRRFLRSGFSKKFQVKSYSGFDPLFISSGISQGEVNDFPEVRKCSESIARTLGVRGPVNIQGRNTKKGFCVFEINPRFSGTTSIRALVGFNEPDVLIRYSILGEKPSVLRYSKGFVVRGLSELYIPYSKMDSHALTWSS